MEAATAVKQNNDKDTRASAAGAFFKPVVVQPKLSINEPGDHYEQEADAMADKVMRMTDPSINPNAFFKPVSNFVQRKCEACEEEDTHVRRKESNNNAVDASTRLDNYISGLGSLGQPMSQASRSFFEPKFGCDFSNVRVHADSEAAKSADSISALAYTSGNNIVFNAGKYAPESESGKKLMAHELTHVVQQGGNIKPKLIQRAPKDDPKDIAARDALLAQIRAEADYKAMDATTKAMAEDIITEIKKKPIALQNSYYLVQLKLIFVKKVKPPAQISTETAASTTTAAVEEQKREAKPEEAKDIGIADKAADDPARAGAWERVAGKFGGGAYYIDRRSLTDIAVKAEVMLNPVGKDGPDSVANIKKMRDGIEKAASTNGYLVSLKFVDVKGPDTFSVDVDPSKWEVATNWSGGDPRGFAHELHHMFAFPLDRYNYIDNQSGNDSMEAKERLRWFRKELSKPDGFNDDNSLMGLYGQHPIDSDVCTVAGLDMKTCMDARQKMAAQPAADQTPKQFTTPDSVNIGPGSKSRIALTIHIDFLPDHTHLKVFTAKEQGGDYVAESTLQVVGDPNKGGDYTIALSAVNAGAFIRFEARSDTTGINVPNVKGTYVLNFN